VSVRWRKIVRSLAGTERRSVHQAAAISTTQA
jgi:hypothetical protein